MQVGNEFLVAKHGQAFLQRELEPVAQGDPITRPVVEILMADHRLDRQIVGVGRGVLVGQDVACVEDIQALVLHRAHGEILRGDDVEHVEVVAATEALLVPTQRTFDRAQRVAATCNIGRRSPCLQPHRAALGSDDVLADAGEVARDQREQITRCRVRVVPNRLVTTIAEIALRDRITVAQQDREARLVRAQCRAPGRQHVAAIGEEGDASETLRLALGEQRIAAAEQAFKAGVALRHDAHAGLQYAGAVDSVDMQAIGIVAIAIGWQRHAVERDREQFEFDTFQHQRSAGLIGATLIKAGFELQRRGHLGGCEIQFEFEFGMHHAPGRRAVIGEQGKRVAGRAIGARKLVGHGCGNGVATRRRRQQASMSQMSRIVTICS